LKTIYEIVENINEHTIMNYEPQPVIIDFVSNFWLKHFDTKTMLEFPIDSFEAYCKETFLKQHPEASENSLDNFASDTVFHLSFRLSKQGRWVDNVTKAANPQKED
jgi:hypothetical protein